MRDVAVAGNGGLCRIGGLRLEISGVFKFLWAVRREACRNTCYMFRSGFPAHFRPKIGVCSTRVSS